MRKHRNKLTQFVESARPLNREGGKESGATETAGSYHISHHY